MTSQGYPAGVRDKLNEREKAKIAMLTRDCHELVDNRMRYFNLELPKHYQEFLSAHKGEKDVPAPGTQLTKDQLNAMIKQNTGSDSIQDLKSKLEKGKRKASEKQRREDRWRQDDVRQAEVKRAEMAKKPAIFRRLSAKANQYPRVGNSGLSSNAKIGLGLAGAGAAAAAGAYGIHKWLQHRKEQARLKKYQNI